MQQALTEAEGAWLVKAMQRLGIPKVEVESSGPGDLCVWLGEETPRIRVGSKWHAAKPHERRKRLLHELLHVKGLRHNAQSRKLGYYSNPERDSYSRKVYRALSGVKL